ncbi:MAG: hypothetical protein IKO35_04475 [Elusimicrobiaceae bacterium]|nr:hypothetical protein [Elusimicrobiaceae bacterium]
MKNIFFVLLIALLVPTVQAATIVDTSSMGPRRLAMIQRYAPKMSEENFLKAVREGDIAAIDQLTESRFLLATDKFGNNCFHLAKDAATVQAIATLVRRFEKNYINTFNFLRNQRNAAGETPVMTHINYGKTDTFRLLYEGSELATAIRAVNAVDKGGALGHTAEVKKGVAFALSKDNSGRTIAQAAAANILVPGMVDIVQYFENNASYLF